MNKPLLRQLNDHSGGGFVLFCFNEEGMPEVTNNFDTNAEALALQYYIQNWSQAVQTINVESMANGIIGEGGEGFEDLSGEDPEEI